MSNKFFRILRFYLSISLSPHSFSVDLSVFSFHFITNVPTNCCLCWLNYYYCLVLARTCSWLLWVSERMCVVTGWQAYELASLHFSLTLFLSSSLSLSLRIQMNYGVRLCWILNTKFTELFSMHVGISCVEECVCILNGEAEKILYVVCCRYTQ